MANHRRNLDCGHRFSTNQISGILTKDVEQMSRFDPSVIVFLIRPDGLWVLDEDKINDKKDGVVAEETRS